MQEKPGRFMVLLQVLEETVMHKIVAELAKFFLLPDISDKGTYILFVQNLLAEEHGKDKMR